MEALTKTEKLTFTMPTDPPGADPVDHRCVGIDQRFLIGLGGIALLVAEKKEIMPKLRLFAVENLGERLNWVSDDGEKSKKEGGDKNVDGMMMKMVIDQTIERIIYLQRSRTEVEVESVLALLEAWRTGLLTSGHSSMTMSPKIRNDRVSEYE